MAAYDLVIRNGIVVDGTGLPRRRADVAVKDGRIAEIGFVEATGAREIDADGRVVAPGIVDPHTHYDPQLTFEPYAHVELLPRRHHRRRRQLRVLRRAAATRRRRRGSSSSSPASRAWTPSALEGIPFDGFETFPEFLASARRPARHQRRLLRRPLRGAAAT